MNTYSPASEVPLVKAGADYVVLTHAVFTASGLTDRGAAPEVGSRAARLGRDALEVLSGVGDVAQEMSLLGRSCLVLSGSDLRGVLAAIREANVAGVQRLWELTVDVVGEVAPSAVAGLPVWVWDRVEGGLDMSHMPYGRIGERYADYAYWAVKALVDLVREAGALTEAVEASSGACSCDCGTCPGADPAAEARRKFEHVLDLVRDMDAFGLQFELLNESSLRATFADLEAITLSRVQSSMRRVPSLREGLGSEDGSAGVRARVVGGVAVGPGRSSDRDWLPPLEGLVEPSVEEEPPVETDTVSLDLVQRKRDSRRESLANRESPYELGDWHAWEYFSAVAAVPGNLDVARERVGDLEAMGRTLDEMEESDRLAFLLGLHHGAVERARSRLRWAEQLLTREYAESEWAADAPEGWPTWVDVAAGRHDGISWVVPVEERYPAAGRVGA